MTEPPLPPDLSPRRQATALRTRPRPASGRARRRRWPRRLGLALLAVVLVLAMVLLGTWIWADGKIRRTDAIADWPGRPAHVAGTNWLLVGSDSRAGLTRAQQRALHVGSDAGTNTDTLMVLHKGANGPVLLSIPRDSWVTVPGHGQSKINAAFAEGGPQLLVRTVESATGIRIDHYLEVGFSGVTDTVDALGGVRMCLGSAVRDSRSGADLSAGCQKLTGRQALALVRTRYSLPDSDLSRIGNQQQFLHALADTVVAPGVLADPFRLYPFLNAALDSVTVDRSSGLWTLAQCARQLQQASGGKGKSLTVPLATQDYATPTGQSAVLWSDAAKTLFTEIRQDRPVG
ncbi:LCP family protein [Streptacidiphilus monticola]|uniref:LCP family protein n=1 Tax=Streptacidiphilus monticola TaxID=2161674 RepID=A0ABW1G640_9ACTN